MNKKGKTYIIVKVNSRAVVSKAVEGALLSREEADKLIEKEERAVVK